jgi:hypothetical protein
VIGMIQYRLGASSAGPSGPRGFALLGADGGGKEPVEGEHR